MSLLAGMNVVVTGAGRGIGRAYAEAVVAAGARVVVNDIDVEAAQEVATSLGDAAVVSGHDVGVWSQAQELVEQCVATFGSIDGLVNNASLLTLTHVQEQTEEDARRLIDVNLVGTIAASTAAFLHMIAQGHGSVVNVTSGEQMGTAKMGVYGATKGVVSSLTYSWASELADTGVRVNAVSPMAYTNMAVIYDDFHRSGQPSVNQGKDPSGNAPALVWLLSSLSERVNGQVVRTDGDSLSLCSHPKIIAPAVRHDGPWDVEAVDRAFAEQLDELQQPLGIRRVEPPRFVDG